MASRGRGIRLTARRVEKPRPLRSLSQTDQTEQTMVHMTKPQSAPVVEASYNLFDFSKAKPLSTVEYLDANQLLRDVPNEIKSGLYNHRDEIRQPEVSPGDHHDQSEEDDLEKSKGTTILHEVRNIAGNLHTYKWNHKEVKQMLQAIRKNSLILDRHHKGEMDSLFNHFRACVKRDDITGVIRGQLMSLIESRARQWRPSPPTEIYYANKIKEEEEKPQKENVPAETYQANERRVSYDKKKRNEKEYLKNFANLKLDYERNDLSMLNIYDGPDHDLDHPFYDINANINNNVEPRRKKIDRNFCLRHLNIGKNVQEVRSPVSSEDKIDLNDLLSKVKSEPPSPIGGVTVKTEPFSPKECSKTQVNSEPPSLLGGVTVKTEPLSPKENSKTPPISKHTPELPEKCDLETVLEFVKNSPPCGVQRLSLNLDAPVKCELDDIAQASSKRSVKTPPGFSTKKLHLEEIAPRGTCKLDEVLPGASKVKTPPGFSSKQRSVVDYSDLITQPEKCYMNGTSVPGSRKTVKTPPGFSSKSRSLVSYTDLDFSERYEIDEINSQEYQSKKSTSPMKFDDTVKSLSPDDVFDEESPVLKGDTTVEHTSPYAFANDCYDKTDDTTDDGRETSSSFLSISSSSDSVENTTPSSDLSQAKRDKFSEDSPRAKLFSSGGETKQYSRQFLIDCSLKEVCLEMPENWGEISRKYPDICLPGPFLFRSSTLTRELDEDTIRNYVIDGHRQIPVSGNWGWGRPHDNL